MTAPSIKHKFVSSIPDGPDDGRVRPSNWNDEHDITGIEPSAGNPPADDYVYTSKADGTRSWQSPAFIVSAIHDEPLTDGLGGFVFDGTDVVVVVGVPN